MDELKVYIIDDEKEITDAIDLLMQSVGLETEIFHSAEAFLDQNSSDMAGCIILDIRMPGMSGMELQNRLYDRGYTPPVIIISGHGDIPMAVNAVKAGAFNFLEKPFDNQELLDNVHKAFKEDLKLRGRSLEVEKIKKRVDLLTPRENEIMFAVINGKRNREIASNLDITLPTVEAHRSKVMKKMQAKSLSELMRMVICIDEIMKKQIA